MSRSTTPLTNTEIKHSKPKTKEYSLGDGGGLFLRVSPNGSKIWLFNYTRPHAGKRANISLGTYPHVTLAQARLGRQDAKALLAKDIDPQRHRDLERSRKAGVAANTLILVTEEWLKLKRTMITAPYADDISQSLRKHIFPALGKYPISEITAPQVIATLKPIATAGKLEMVKRLSQRLNEVMIYATNTGLVHNNPLAGIRFAFQTPTKINNPTLCLLYTSDAADE